MREHTIPEIAAYFGVSHQRITQLIKRALKKLQKKLKEQEDENAESNYRTPRG